MGVYDTVDLRWTWDGDYTIGDNGDLGDTSDNLLSSLEQELHTVVKSELTDWQLDPLLGANLSDFVGEPNTLENGRAIEHRLRQKIIEAQIVSNGDLAVRVVPVGIHEIMIMINVDVMATAENKLVIGESISVNLLFDTMENGLFFLPPSTNEEIEVR